MKKKTETKTENFMIFKSNINQSTVRKPVGEFLEPATKKEIITDATTDDNEILTVIFKNNINQFIAEKPIGSSSELVTKGEIISKITRDDSERLIVAEFTYKAIDAKALSSEVTKNAFESFISSKMETKFRHLNLGSQGWFGEPISEQSEFSSEKIEFTKSYRRDMKQSSDSK